MASISYNNVPAEQGGNIFSNIKFWIHRGVPLRSDWVKHVEENGGQVVDLEKKADYLIADHLKARNAPDGAYSWKLIQESVKNGALQIADRFLIGPHPDDVRRIAATKAPKSTRTAYTNEDDGLLGTVGSSAVQPTKSSVLTASVASKQNTPSSSERQAKSHAGSSRQGTVQTTNPPLAQSPEISRQADLDHSPNVEGVRETSSETNSENNPETNAEPQPTVDIVAAVVDDEEEDDQNNEEEDAKNQFYGDLENFAFQSGKSIQFELRIQGHGRVELWELMQPVFAQDAQPNDIDWAKIAADLDIEPNEKNKNKLSAYFEKNVADFVAHLYTLEQSRDDSADEGAANKVSQDAGSAVKDSVEVPRRSREYAVDSGSMENQPDKRQKVDHVPGAPGARLQPTTSQAPEEQQFTGTARRLFASKDLQEIKDSQEDTQAVLQSPAVHSRSVEATLPVNQSRTRGNHAIRREDTMVDISPSQQLQEELNASPRVSRRPNDTGTGRRDRSIKRKLPSSFNTNVRPPPSQPVPAASSSRPDTNHHSHLTPSLSTIEEYMTYYESLGYSRSIVKRALQATTMTPGGPAAFAMEHLNQRHKDLPSDIAGVWTERDDRALRFVMLLSHDGQSLDREGKDRRERLLLERARMKRARLLEKHGRQRMKLREKWLNVKGLS
ncbi:uncharacterized protein J7T54_004134 [Emericellopsis cladophorae]|uniref:DNA-binding protein RAP1 n=1 Tax=Emericellopsis cladophorae TaxID=2686198 RepID=A0A9P9XUV9_9HYPO|nr:uncharacterized protein J7T54_004134 [Emericellopsis cladophorae]KAI6778239.1 hypothetical protein J7T54_004134 [Emericellopsis cladophorae]